MEKTKAMKRLLVALGVAVSATVGLLAASAPASADSIPTSHGFPVFSPFVISTDCVAGRPASYTVSTRWSATGVKGAFPTLSAVFEVDDGSATAVTFTRSSDVVVTPGTNGTYTRTFPVTSSTNATNTSIDIEDATGFVWLGAHASFGCHDLPAQSAPVASLKSHACSGAFSVRFDGSATASDWGYQLVYGSGTFSANAPTLTAGSSALLSVTAAQAGAEKTVFAALYGYYSGYDVYDTSALLSLAKSPSCPRAGAMSITKSLSIKAGKSTVIKTHFTVKGSTKPVAGATVSLLKRSKPSGPWTLVKTVKTNKAGAASVTIHPAKCLYLEWKYAGGAKYAATLSPATKVTVTH
ncbi:hypothetical protein M6D93_11075 [Jatrophihabitans telluris]|uniref:Ig-like domain repeat protein n=1 Tax=Jatrophihabitans telluris TaxID=2038343 RepID=A0ABY4QU45_9ACTN|nr:hypothetical protein [Jatrophihabitans telluris]UQX86849.1 hypothetical protein M6D93_11075 [Jatrophihabitans telluris]